VRLRPSDLLTSDPRIFGHGYQGGIITTHFRSRLFLGTYPHVQSGHDSG
jgi:hypothetical protein